ncbi:pilus assembly protein [Dyella psychrodurans]|nr:PilC/PilY family type IV pilus protein [Dyella psychrodurans]
MTMSRISLEQLAKWSVACAVAVMCMNASSTSSARTSATQLPGTVELSPLPLDQSQDDSLRTVLGVNTGVLATGALAFEGGYDPADWSGQMRAVVLNADGALSQVLWDAGLLLTNPSVTPPIRRALLTLHTDSTTGDTIGMSFEPWSDFDPVEMKGLMTPASRDVGDTLETRVEYLRGERGEETTGVMRERKSLLGAIVNAQAVYVGRPTGNYSDAWPTKIQGISVASPEMEPDAQSYDQFVTSNADRQPVVYVGANDGMLHAFYAPVPHCTMYDEQGDCTRYDPGANAGKEVFAFVPRGVYGNLGNLTSADAFLFAPTVDATPVVRDVFFAEHGDHAWHTLLVGGLRLGGRGVYALDVTHPVSTNEVAAQRTVLWEFDADARPGTTPYGNTYNPTDLGYTYGQPAIARLANGRWAVLVPGGYFPDCSKPDRPVRCEAAARTAPADFSVLFVLDAQTGEVIAELKTPTDIAGVASYGLSSPVLGDYDNDQVDDVAFAGDLAGNLWRFDLSSPDPANWKATLAYRPEVQGAQPINVMPRLFPDPVTNRFMVVFGTGKYLGEGDVSRDVPVQAVYGIKDRVDSRGNPVTVSHESLQAQTLTETTVSDPTSSYAGATLRSLTSNPVAPAAGGWYFDLDVASGERVVVTPTALFNTNSVLVSTLIPKGGSNSSSGLKGSVMAVDALTGGPGNSLSSSGNVSYVGGLIDRPRTAGTLPVATMMGGGKLLLPGLMLKSSNSGLKWPLSFGSPTWRRRSWSILSQDP